MQIELRAIDAKVEAVRAKVEAVNVRVGAVQARHDSLGDVVKYAGEERARRIKQECEQIKFVTVIHVVASVGFVKEVQTESQPTNCYDQQREMGGY